MFYIVSDYANYCLNLLESLHLENIKILLYAMNLRLFGSYLHGNKSTDFATVSCLDGKLILQNMERYLLIKGARNEAVKNNCSYWIILSIK